MKGRGNMSNIKEKQQSNPYLERRESRLEVMQMRLQSGLKESQASSGGTHLDDSDQ